MSGMPDLRSCRDSRRSNSSGPHQSNEVTSNEGRRPTNYHTSDGQRVLDAASGSCAMHFASWAQLGIGNKEQTQTSMPRNESDHMELITDTAEEMDESRTAEGEGASMVTDIEPEQIWLQDSSIAQATDKGGLSKHEPIGPTNECSQEEHGTLSLDDQNVAVDSLTTKSYEKESWAEMVEVESEHAAFSATNITSENWSITSTSGDQSKTTSSVTTTSREQKSWTEMVEEDLEDGTSKLMDIGLEQNTRTSSLADQNMAIEVLVAKCEEKKSWADIVKEEEEEELQAAVARFGCNEGQIEQAPVRLRSVAELHEAIRDGTQIDRDKEELRAMFTALMGPSRDSSRNCDDRRCLQEDGNNQVRPKRKDGTRKSIASKSKPQWPPRRTRNPYVKPPDSLTAEMMTYDQRQEPKSISTTRAPSVDPAESEPEDADANPAAFPYTALMKRKYPPSGPPGQSEELELTKSQLSSNLSASVHDHSPTSSNQASATPTTTSPEVHEPPVIKNTNSLEETVSLRDRSPSIQERDCSPASESLGNLATETNNSGEETAVVPAKSLPNLRKGNFDVTESHDVPDTKRNARRGGAVAVPIIGLLHLQRGRSIVKERVNVPDARSRPMSDETVHTPARSSHSSPSGYPPTGGGYSQASPNKDQSERMKEARLSVSNSPSKQAEVVSNKKRKSKGTRSQQSRQGAGPGLITDSPVSDQVSAVSVDKFQDGEFENAGSTTETFTTPDINPHTPKKPRPFTWADLVRGTPTSRQPERAASSWSESVSGKPTAPQSQTLKPLTSAASPQPRTYARETSADAARTSINQRKKSGKPDDKQRERNSGPATQLASEEEQQPDLQEVMARNNKSRTDDHHQGTTQFASEKQSVERSKSDTSTDVWKEFIIQNPPPSISIPTEEKPTSMRLPGATYASIVRGEHLLRPKTLTSPRSPPTSASSLSPSLGGYLTAPQTPLQIHEADGMSVGSSNDKFYLGKESLDGSSDSHLQIDHCKDRLSVSDITGGSTALNDLIETPNQIRLESNEVKELASTEADTPMMQDTVPASTKIDPCTPSQSESSAHGSRRVLEALDLAAPGRQLPVVMQGGHRNIVGDLESDDNEDVHDDRSKSSTTAAGKNIELQEDLNDLNSERDSTCARDAEGKTASDFSQGESQQSPAAELESTIETGAQTEASEELPKKGTIIPEIGEDSAAPSFTGEVEMASEKQTPVWHSDRGATMLRTRVDSTRSVLSLPLEVLRLQDMRRSRRPHVNGTPSMMMSSPYNGSHTSGRTSSTSSYTGNHRTSFPDTRSPLSTYSFCPAPVHLPYPPAYPTWEHHFPTGAVPRAPQPIYIPASMMIQPGVICPYPPYPTHQPILHPHFPPHPLPYLPFMLPPPPHGACPPNTFQPPSTHEVSPPESNKPTPHARHRSAVEILTESAFGPLGPNTDPSINIVALSAGVHDTTETTTGSMEEYQLPSNLPLPPPPPPPHPHLTQQHNPRRIISAPTPSIPVEKKSNARPQDEASTEKRQMAGASLRMIKPCRRTVIESATEMINWSCERCAPIGELSLLD